MREKSILVAAALSALALPAIQLSADLVVNIPDANLEWRIRMHLWVPEPAPITDADMLALTDLVADNGGYEDYPER